MKLTNKAKRWLIVTALGLMCIVLIIAISSRFKAEKPEAAMKPVTPEVTNQITPEVSAPTHTTTPVPTLTVTPEVSVQPIEPTATPALTQDTGDSKGTEQSIQAEVTKPAEPSEEVKVDPTKKPDGESVDKEKPKEKKDTKKDSNKKKDSGSKKDSVSKKDSGTSSSSNPKSGDKNEKGQIWVPGFGWVDDSGDNVGIEVEDMYENGNKIGIMD